MWFHRPVLRIGAGHPNIRFARLYSDSRRTIDEFNKHKKEYKFGHGIDDTEDAAPGRRPAQQDYQDRERNFEFQQYLGSHPKMQQLRPGSPETKETISQLHREFHEKQKNDHHRFEFIERLKGMAAGAAAIVGIVAVYQLVMNWKLLKTKFRSWKDFDVDLSQLKDMNDPTANTRRVANLAERLAVEVDDSFVSALQDSRAVPGLYIFGAVAGKKLPMRVAGFDGKYLADVVLTDDYLVAVDEKGTAWHYSRALAKPVAVAVPKKIARVLCSGDGFYYVARNGKDVFYGGRLDSNSMRRTNLFSSSVSYTVQKVSMDALARGEKIASVAAGDSHLAILSTTGRLFEVCTRERPLNKGQFGMPQYSGLAGQTDIPTNTLFELKNINNEVVTVNGTKTVQPRVFTAIAATRNSCAAMDSAGNLWTWGDNSSCQCGRDVSIADDMQVVPKIVYTQRDLERLSKYSVEDHGTKGKFQIGGLAAAGDTVFLKMAYLPDEENVKGQELLLSFGGGLKGQLGLSRYIHMTATPQVLRSLVGMQEYDEAARQTKNIGIKDVVGGGDHVFVTLDNVGLQKDLLVFGDNSRGQFGNGRVVKSGKPSPMPSLLEPADFEDSRPILAKRVHDQTRNRLRLGDGEMRGVEQVVAAGDNSSAIFYRRK